MTGHIFINGEIGVVTTPNSVRNQISPEFSDYEIHINSFGGDVYDGYQIGNTILNLSKPTLAIVEGMCASIATYIACCADKVSMIPQGSWTIHDPTAQTGGRAEDLLKAASQLNDIKASIVSRYLTKVAKNGITAEQLWKAMAAETTYDSDEAKKWGFVDDVREKMRAVAKIDLNKFKMETLSKQETLGLFERLGQKIDGLIKKKPIIKKSIAKVKPKAKVIKPKNIEVTLTDGTVLNVDASDPNDLIGSQVSNQDGSAIADGTYQTVDGLELDISGGMILSTEQEPTNESEDDPSLDKDPNLKNDDDPEDDEDDSPEDDDEPEDDEDSPEDDEDPEDDEGDDQDMKKIKYMKAQLAALQRKVKTKKAAPGAQPATKAPSAKDKNKFQNVIQSLEKQVIESQKQIAELKKMTIGKSQPPSAKPIEEQEEPDEQTTAFANDVVNYYESRGFLKRVN